MNFKKKLSFTTKVLIGLILGIVVGVTLNLFAPQSFNIALGKWVLGPIGDMFLRGIKMVVAPLVLFSLICGTASIKDIKKLGRVGGKIISYYMLTTAVAITLALAFANILKPGVGNIQIPPPQNFTPTEAPFIMDMFVKMIPTNPFEALVKGDMLQIIVFAILSGIALTMIGKKAEPLVKLFEQINEVLLKIIGIVMGFAPYAVFALLSKVIMDQGVDVLISLFKYVFVVVLLLFIYTFGVNGLCLRILGKLNPITFFKKYLDVMLVAFSTSSSNASIPINLKTCNEKLGVEESISSFTIPLGATINMNGTAIMQGVAAIFIAQVFNLNLSLQQQLMVILVATLSSIGTAGVPSAGIVMLTMVLQQVGLPIEGAALVLSVDRIVDMFRTTANVTGDAVGTVIVANSEKELDREIYYKK